MRKEKVKAESERYITAWHDLRAHTGDDGIALWTVRNAMYDIGYWAGGDDPNGANQERYSPEESLILYRLLAAVATSYGFCPDEELIKG